MEDDDPYLLLKQLFYTKSGKVRSTENIKELLNRAKIQEQDPEIIRLLQGELKRREEPGWENGLPIPF